MSLSVKAAENLPRFQFRTQEERKHLGRLFRRFPEVADNLDSLWNVDEKTMLKFKRAQGYLMSGNKDHFNANWPTTYKEEYDRVIQASELAEQTRRTRGLLKSIIPRRSPTASKSVQQRPSYQSDTDDEDIHHQLDQDEQNRQDVQAVQTVE